MKILLATLSLLLCQSILAAETKIFHDSFIRGDLDSVTLAEIYLSLPQDFFDLSYSERIESLLKGRVLINEEKKMVRLGGDGGQSTIEFTVKEQTKVSLTLEFMTQLESDKSFWILERIKNGWKGIQKNAG